MGVPFGFKFLFHDRRQVEGDFAARERGRLSSLPGGSLARCGCRVENGRLKKRRTCSIHSPVRIYRGNCPTCLDRRWAPAGVGWGGWALRSRCPQCNPLPEQEASDALVRRLAPCRKTWTWVVKTFRKTTAKDW